MKSGNHASQGLQLCQEQKCLRGLARCNTVIVIRGTRRTDVFSLQTPGGAVDIGNPVTRIDFMGTTDTFGKVPLIETIL